MDKKAIAFVHYNSSPGGIELIIPDIADRMTDYAFSAFVIRPHPPGKPNVYLNRPVRLHYGSSFNPAAALKLLHFSFKNRRSLFHVFNIGPFFLLIMRLAGVKRLVYSIHGTQYWKNNLQRSFLRLIWKFSLAPRYIMTANSEFSRKVFIENVISGHEIIVLYNPVDHERFRPAGAKAVMPRQTEIIYCGRLDKEKNPEEWIRIARAVLRKMPDVHFKMYGDGAERNRLQNLIDSFNISDRVVLKGFTSEPEKVMQEADLMIFVSKHESFGNVVVESILCGTPVLAVSIPSMQEIFRDFPEFLFTPDGSDEEELILKIKDHEKLRLLAARARESFMTRFGPENHYTKLRELYNKILQY